MLRVLIGWLGISFLLGVSIAAKDVPGEYIVLLSGEPAIATAAPKSPRLAASRLAVRSAQATVRKALEGKQVDVIASLDTVLNALVVKSADASVLAGTAGVAQVFPVRLYKKLLDRAALLQKVPAAWDTVGGWENAGAGMKIAIVDSGVDASHPAFRDAGLAMPNGFPRVNKDTDNRYTNNKVIVARNYDTRVSATVEDRDGHGTAVAMVAAGSRITAPRATITGIAPKAYLGSYKVFPDNEEGAPTSYLLKAIDDAVADGMDVINLSLGGFPAERLELDPVAQAVENATRAGVIVVVAAGNEGPGLNTIGSPATAASAISVGSSSSDRVFAATAWIDGADPFVAIPAGVPTSVTNVRAEIVDVSSIDSTGLACTELPGGSLAGKLALVLRGTCFFEEKLNIAQRAGAVAAVVYTDEARPEPLTMAVGAATLPAVMISYQDGLRAKQRLAGAGSVTAVVDFETKPVFVNSTRLADSTSKGPGIQNLIKPDLVATGTSIYTAQPVSSGEPRYAAMNGTSFSAPMVAGAAALLKAHRPGLNADQYKSLLANSATVFSVNDVTYPVQHTGSGLLDLTAAVRSSVTATPSSLNFGVGASALDAAQRIVVKNIGTTPDTFSIVAAPLTTGVVPEVTPNAIELQPGATAEIVVRLTATNLPAQAHEGFLMVRGTQSEVASRIPYWYGVTNGIVASIDVVEAPETARLSSTAEFLVRSLDGTGVPVNAQPTVKVVQGAGARVNSVDSYDYRYPGFFRVRVRLGSEAGSNIFEIDSGSAVARVTINGD